MSNGLNVMAAMLLTALLGLAFGTQAAAAAQTAAAGAPSGAPTGGAAKTAARAAKTSPPTDSPATPTSQELAGIWQGKMKVDANTSLTIQFTFARKPDGAWSATLNSPDNGAIKNVAANAVSLNNGAVKVDVAALSGSYSGTFRGRSIEGQWTQPGGAIPLVLSPYEKPQLSKAAIDMLVGGWHGPLQLPGGSITFVVQFKESGQGELQGMWGVLEQGGAQTPLHDIEFADNKLSFKGPQGGEYDGTYAAGAFTGAWKTPGAPPQGMPLKLQKGELAPPVYALHLSASAFAALSGDWGGTMQVTPPQGQPVTLEMVVHFVTNQSGDSIGTLDSPTQHISGIPLTAASLEGGKVMLRADTIKGEFHGDLAGKTMTGQWMQGPTTAPLVLKKR